MEPDSSRRVQGPFFVGIIMIVVGIIFLLDSFDVIYVGIPITRFWPLLIVAFGLVRLAQADTISDRRHGAFLVFIGLWLLVSVLHIFGLSFHNSWPLLLIGVGINSIWKAVSPQPECRLSKG